MFSSQFCHSPPRPWRKISGRPVAAGVDHVHLAAEHGLDAGQGRPVERSSRSSRRRRRTRGRARPRRKALAGSARTCPMNPDTPLPYQRPCASRSTSIRRCTRTGTSSPRSPSAASTSSSRTRAQSTWAIQRLTPEQLKLCVQETHRPEHVLAAEPYPGAVETITRWHEQGHFIHITSHRATDAHAHTSEWLDEHRPAARRAVLLLRQDRPLRRDRDRRPDRRLAGQPRAAPSTPGSPRRRSSTRGTGISTA